MNGTDIAAICKALGEESRLRIMMCLQDTELCLCQLAEILELASSTVSQHVDHLISAGLLAERKEGRWHYYRWAAGAPAPHIDEIQMWLRRYCTGDAQIQTDAARRAVVMKNSTAPCPQQARTRVLFLCTGNSCRSQMAEALLRSLGHGAYEVFSAGLDPKPIHQLTYEVMDEIGMDIHGQQPTDILRYLGNMHFGYLITVCNNAEARCPVFPGISSRLYWPIEDPAAVEGPRERRLEAFRQARDDLRARIEAWLCEQEPVLRNTKPV